MSKELVTPVEGASDSGDKESTRSKWILPILTTAVGVLVTILVGWYQISKAEDEVRKAEIEREKAVKLTLVSIIEEHVLNGKQLDLSRLRRIAELQAKEQAIRRSLPIIELIEKAEFNILNSRYLGFDSKEAYKSVFDSIYVKIAQNTTITYDGRHPNLVSDLIASLQKGRTEDITLKLNRLLEAFNADIEELEVRSTPAKTLFSFAETLQQSPVSILSFIIAYLLLGTVIIVYVWIRRRQRLELQRQRLELFRQEALYESMKRHFDMDTENESDDESGG